MLSLNDYDLYVHCQMGDSWYFKTLISKAEPFKPTLPF